ncbi:MAG: tripartite tricarboxylate transporter substrate binding protein [Burkholderiales bacterium]|nr:tripartite tricarboxylate transporter substrate binding protein [Burkholderiales bacterium]
MDANRRLLLAAGMTWPIASLAQSFPARPIRLVVPLAPGGATDIVARLIADKAGPLLGQPITVDNRPGAGGTLGSGVVASAAPDGHTLLMGTVGSLAISPGMYRSLPYDTERDLSPVALVGSGNFVLAVSPAVPATNLQEFVRMARSRPGELNYGSAGNASMPHLGMELLGAAAGIRLVHVPYKSSGQLVTSLMAGEVHAGMPDLPSVIQQFRAGRLRILAVAGSARDALIPDVATIAESGVPNVEISSWMGILAPARTPSPVLTQLNDAIARTLASPEVATRLRELGMRPTASTQADFRAFIQRERTKWESVIRASGATVE